MGLDDLVPDDKKTSSSSTSRSRKRKKQDDDEVVIGGEPYKKVFEKEKWEKVKKFISNEMGLVPNEVVNNYSAEERYEIVHEAALAVDKEIEPEDANNYSQRRCKVCDAGLGEMGVKLGEYWFCSNHPAAKLKPFLGDEDGD